MGRFVKGQAKPLNSGRKKGVPNKIKKVAQFLAEEGIHPAQEILKIIKSGCLESKDEVNAWMVLLSYCQGKPKNTDDENDEFNPDEFEEVSSADLLKLVDTNGAS